MSNKDSNSSSIYTVFNTFFEDEIKKQGVKGNWIFRLNEVNGFHKFVLLSTDRITAWYGNRLSFFSVISNS